MHSRPLILALGILFGLPACTGEVLDFQDSPATDAAGLVELDAAVLASCATDLDCLAPGLSHCASDTRRCVACDRPEHCGGNPCDLTSHTCVATLDAGLPAGPDASLAGPDAGPADAADPCQAVACGGNAGCQMGACVCLAGFEGDPVAGCTPAAVTEQRVRAELIKVGTAEVGMCEGVDDRPYMRGQPGLWCYDFVAWVYAQAGQNLAVSLPPPQDLPTHQVGSLPQGWLPAGGDMIKFVIQHYGMVETASADLAVINTIEGNYGHCVVKNSVTLGQISYFGTLDDRFP